MAYRDHLSKGRSWTGNLEFEDEFHVVITQPDSKLSFSVRVDIHGEMDGRYLDRVGKLLCSIAAEIRKSDKGL